MTVRKSIAIALLGAMGAFGMMQPAIPGMNQIVSGRRSGTAVTSTTDRFFMDGEFIYRKKDGHSVAHGKRMATKARNVKRHKRATKGGAK